MDGLGPNRACIRVRVPAKLNLFLAVRGRRPDGFHELVTVMQTVSLFDRLRVAFDGPPGRGNHPSTRRQMGVELRTGHVEGMPEGADNLAVRAAVALGKVAGIRQPGVGAGLARIAAAGTRTVIDLDKDIPVAGGMAGGSADAAAALVALNQLWRCELDRDQLREVAASLGSDVPFCVVGGTALATGRGTALAQVLCRGRFSWVVCTDPEPLSTADVYRTWDRACRPSEIEADAVLAALRGQDAVALGAALHNDLERAAFTLRPDLEDAKKALLDAGALGAVLSGSGPTLLALCADDTAATEVAQTVRHRHQRVVVATSPAGGPEVTRC